MSTIFSKIVRGEIPCYKIAENEQFIAFLDLMPLEKGHCLVIPKKEVDYIFDLENDEFQALHLFSKRVAMAIGKTIPCIRIGIAVIGLEVPHAHIHLVPLHELGSLNFSKVRKSYSKQEFETTAQEINNNFI
jgi:histidine triad (HIT) family protein